MSQIDKSIRRVSKDPRIETTTALKLLSNYAESYKMLEKENKSLQHYINDLKANIKISKEIINTFLSTNSDKKYQTLSLSYQKQQKFLSSRIEELTKANIELDKQNFKLLESLNLLKEQIETSKTKIFLLEQTIEKKENIILSYKKSANKNALVVISPDKALIKMNDELITYKNVYEKVSKYLKKSGERLDRYENIIADLQTEKEQLKTQNEIQEYSAIREKENLIYKLRTTMININNNNNNIEDKSSRSQNTLKRNINITNKNVNLIKGLNLHNNGYENELLKKKLKFGDTLGEDKVNKSFDDVVETEIKSIDSENEEFCEVLRQAGIPAMTYYMMTTNKGYSKIIDALEFMYKLVTDKKMTIKILECENDDLRVKNFQLNKENMELLSKQKEINDNMINNQSKITINNVNINTLRNYQKILQNNNKDLENEYNETGSIVYNPNKNKSSIEKDDEYFKKNIEIKKYTSSMINKKKNENIMTLSSVTSSEFGKDCQNLESFVSSIGEQDNNTINQTKNNNETSEEIDIEIEQINEK